MNINRLYCSALFLVSLVGLTAHAQSQNQPKSAVPLEPIGAIVNAFKSYSVVALGEGAHGNEQSHAFRLSLVRDPRFAETVNDIVVEFGNGRYQSVMDRYIRGEDVPRDQLRDVWQNTMVEGTLWDAPIYEEFYRAVRDVNSRLPKERQLRVLLGDFPIDWDSVHSWSDFSKYRRDDAFPVEVIQKDVIAKKRRALVIYGDGHYWRKNFFFPLEDMALAEERFATPNRSIVTRLEQAGTKVFSIATVTHVDLSTMQPDVAKWVPPKLALLRDTLLGMASATNYYGSGDVYVTVDREKGTEERTRADPTRSPKMQEQFDAIMYLGPPSAMTRTKLSPELCKDAEYTKMRLKRFETITPPGATDFGSGFRKFCAGIIEN